MKGDDRGGPIDALLGLAISSLALFLAPLFIALLGHGEANRGISWIGQGCAANAPCEPIMAAYRGASVINAGWLYGTFNPDGCKCSKVVLADPRPKRIRVSICNSTCFPERGRRCMKHECFAGMNGRQASRAIMRGDAATFARIDRTIALAKADMALAAQPVEFWVKPCLECFISVEARYKLNDYVASKFPGLPIVDNPVKGLCAPGLVCERHGDVKGGPNTIVDLDGVDYRRIRKAEFWAKNDNALMALAWKPCANGWKPGPFVPPTMRKAYCTQKEGNQFNDAIMKKGLG